MTHWIAYEYDEILHGLLPGVDSNIVYQCESEIEYGEDGEEVSNRLISVEPFVNRQPAPFYYFPKENGSEQEKRFLALMRESARQALYARQLRESKEVS